jgi:hypothetical protein
MSCILRVAGKDLNLKDLLKINLKPDSTYEKGSPRRKGSKSSSSGARYVVSEADFDQFEQQKLDAIKFLKRNKDRIQEIMDLNGIDGADLDFGIHRRDVPVQCDNFPSDLIKLAGNLGLGLELSQYPSDEGDEEESEPTL